MAIFTVTNTNDSGVGSLRQAIMDSNSSGGSNTIIFDASLAGQTIIITNTLPVNTNAVIDANVNLSIQDIIDGDVITDIGDDTVTNESDVFGGVITGNGNDTVINNSSIGNDLSTGSGNDTITNGGAADGFAFIGGSVSTGVGDDMVTNNADIGTDLNTGDGNDTVINNSFIGNDLSTGSGNDTITNGGAHIRLTLNRGWR